jgi:hypothetical protein
MADFGFVGASYTAPSIYQDDQECINWRPEVDFAKGQGERGVIALYPTPGLTKLLTFPNLQQVRGLRAISSGGSQLIAVCGAYVYAVAYNFKFSIIGQLLSANGPVSITDNGVYVYIVDGKNRYSWLINAPDTTNFTGYISGNTLNVVAIGNGSLSVGQQIYGIGVLPGTVITGGNGYLWTVNKTQNIGQQVLYGNPPQAIFTGSVSGTTLTVTAVNSGTLYVGLTITGNNIPTDTIITSLGTGSGGNGTYTLNTISKTIGSITFVSTTATLTTTTPHNLTSGQTITIAGASPSNYNGTYTVAVTGPNTFNYTMATAPATNATVVGAYSITVGSETMYAQQFTLIPATDGAFTGGGIVDTNDNYFIYTRPGTQQFAVSDILSPITQSTSFASKFTSPDNLVSLIANNGQLFLIGEKSSEVWNDQGTFPVAYQRIPGSSTQQGIIAPFSVARVGNSFAYVSQNIRGLNQIVMMNGYIPQRISTHAVENSLLDQYTEDAIAYTYQLEGHEVYVVSFPTIDITWAYDFTTQLWHKWLWVDAYDNYHRHRSNCAAVFQGYVVVGDWENGNLYQLDQSAYTDNGNEIRRLRRAPHLVTDLQRQYFDELQLQFQPGVGINGFSRDRNTYLGDPFIIGASETFVIKYQDIDVIGYAGQISVRDVLYNPKAMLRWSNDGGSTWSKEYWQDIGQQGKYKHRAIWRRLGMARDRIFEVVVSDPVKAVIVSANLKASSGDN